MGQFQSHLAEHWETVSVSILIQSFTGKIGWWRIISSIHLSNVQGICSSRSQLSGEQSWNGVWTVCKMRKRCLYVVTFSRCSNRWFEFGSFNQDVSLAGTWNISCLPSAAYCCECTWEKVAIDSSGWLGPKSSQIKLNLFLNPLFFTNASSHLHPSCYIMCCCRLSVHCSGGSCSSWAAAAGQMWTWQN